MYTLSNMDIYNTGIKIVYRNKIQYSITIKFWADTGSLGIAKLSQIIWVHATGIILILYTITFTIYYEL